MQRNTRFGAVTLALAIVLVGCNSPSRMGMVQEPETGLQFGSIVEKNLVTDPSFYKNRKIKVRIRNTSGDTAFDLKGFQRRIESAYAETGYTPTTDNEFGLLVDVNVMYSGQVQRNFGSEFAFLGAAAGGLAGASHGGTIATAAGTVAGATLGNIIGSYVTDDTYIIITRVTFGKVRGASQKDGKRITFSRSARSEDYERDEERQTRGFASTFSTGVAVFAGGRNVPQHRISEQVRQRIVRIIRDIV